LPLKKDNFKVIKAAALAAKSQIVCIRCNIKKV
jgi:hypothetical protein